MRILIVEDEEKVGRLLCRGLQEQAYSATWVRSCAAARDALCESPFDCIVLDLGLPDGDGLDLLREWRAAGFAEPVLILSARDAVADRVRGLNLGADDYLAKPFSLEELLARVRSQMRRSGTTRSTHLACGSLAMDLLARSVTVDGQALELTNREFALLELLLQQQGRVVTRTQIADAIWDSNYEMADNLIEVYVARLRRKLEAQGLPPVLKTVRGTGYRLG